MTKRTRKREPDMKRHLHPDAQVDFRRGGGSGLRVSWPWDVGVLLEGDVGTGGESIFPMIMAGRREMERFRWPLSVYTGAAVAASTGMRWMERGL